MKYFRQKRVETGGPWGHGAYSDTPQGPIMENRKTSVPGSGFKRFINMLDNNFWLLAVMTLGITALIMGWWIISGEGPDGIRLFDRPQQASEQAPQKSDTVSDQSVGQLEDQLTGLVDRVNMLTDSINYLESKLIRAHVLTDSIITAEQRASTTTPDQPAVARTVQRINELPSSAAGQVTSDSELAKSRQVNTARITTAARQLIENAAQGPWVVNLISSPSQADADRFAAMARSRGIETQQQQVTVKGKDYWRVQTTGFPTAAEAQTYAGTVREKLELPNVWITRR